MRDEILNVGSAFDWITPTIAFIQDLFSGPASDFGISASSGWRRNDIKSLMKNHGMRVWGVMLNLGGDMLMFTVPKAQAESVYALLRQEGIPILYAPAEVLNPSADALLKQRNTANPLEPAFNLLDTLDNDF